MSATRQLERVVAGAAAAILLVASVTVTTRMSDRTDGSLPDPPSASVLHDTVSEPGPAGDSIGTPTPTASETTPPAAETTAPATIRVIDPEEGDHAAPARAAAAPPPPSGPSSTTWFESRYPRHAAAVQDPDDPRTTRWAVIVGVNEHSGRTRTNVGSRQEAESLAGHLRQLGWLDDHVLLLTDGTATQRHMLEAIDWLAGKTDRDSVAVFHYSGHMKRWSTTEVGLWPSDNRHISNGTFGARMAAVRAGRLWINISACHAAAVARPELRREGRLLTFSSRVEQKSYEDPSLSMSVWGWYLTEQGLGAGRGDQNRDGDVTVQEAFAWARPRAHEHTERGSAGPQTPVIMDDLGRDFSLVVPKPPPPPPPPEPEPSDRPCLLILCP